MIRDRSACDSDDVVVLGQEPERRRRVGVGERRVRDVEQLAARLVAEGPEAGSQRLEDLAAPGEPRPRRDVRGRRRPERRQVPEDEVRDGRRIRPLAAFRARPGVETPPARLAGPSPQPARRDLDDRQQEPRGIRERGRRASGPARLESSSELGERQRLVEHRPGGVEDVVDLDPGQVLAERAVRPGPGEDRPDDGPQRACVLRRHEVERRAQEADPDDAPVRERVRDARRPRTRRRATRARGTGRAGSAPGARRGARPSTAAASPSARGGAGGRAARG